MSFRLRFLIVGLIVAVAIGLAYLAYRRGQVHEIALAAGPADGEGFRVAQAIAEVTSAADVEARVGSNASIATSGAVMVDAALQGLDKNKALQ